MAVIPPKVTGKEEGRAKGLDWGKEVGEPLYSPLGEPLPVQCMTVCNKLPNFVWQCVKPKSS